MTARDSLEKATRPRLCTVENLGEVSINRRSLCSIVLCFGFFFLLGICFCRSFGERLLLGMTYEFHVGIADDHGIQELLGMGIAMDNRHRDGI